ncbi:MAG: ATP-binding protein [Kiritimatiellia bacterium]
MGNKVYKLEIDPGILKLLGPSLYTNIYYVLAELIANAWDADANNVYIIDDGDKIIIEDDGLGMSYSKGGVQKYLSVAHETRINDEDSFTPSKRTKMGRKGIGKLSALAVSKNVNVMTIQDGEKSGFVLSRVISHNGELTPIPESEIKFYKINDHGTSIQMFEPEYKLNKGIDVIKRNISKMFPVISEDFKIHVIKDGNMAVIDDFDKTVISQLASLITIGDGYKDLRDSFNPEVSERGLELVDSRSTEEITLKLFDKEKVEREYVMRIEGWIGTYKSTRNRKTEVLEFQDNFLSLYSHGKLGEFNILPRIGQNRLPEVYVVGQLHVDLFEETSLPDMALSNRQGYKDDDKRYEEATLYAQELLRDITNLRVIWSSIRTKDKRRDEMELHKSREAAFKESVVSFEDKVTSDVAKAITEDTSFEITDITSVRKIVKDSLEKHKILLGLKPHIDREKKRILISQTKKDKDLSDTIYEMLQFNGVPKKDILYTNSDDEIARVPEGYNIYEYIRTFFVDSVSDEKMYVVYVTSSDMGQSWGAIVEVGANWITQMNHKIFNINKFRPDHPLNVEAEWHQTSRNEQRNLEMDSVNLDSFCVKIENLCHELGYAVKTRDENKEKLKQLVIAVS